MEELGEDLELESIGIALRNQGDQPFDPERDLQLLEARLEAKIGEDTIESIQFSKDLKDAFIEVKEREDLEKLLSSSVSLTKKKPPLIMKRINLMDIKQFYLTVKGLEDWMDEDMVRDHFKAEANGEDVQSVTVKEGTAIIRFVRPKVALKFKSVKETEMLGLTITLEVGEDMSVAMGGQEEEIVLCVKNLPGKIPAQRLQTSLEKHLLKHTDKVIKTCVVSDGVGYVSFEDPADIQSIVDNPPTANFFANTQLQYLTSPMSEVESLFAASPDQSSLNTSVTSSVFQEEYSRNSSMDSMSSIDPSRSINQSDYRFRQTSSNSSVMDTVRQPGNRQRNAYSNSSEEFSEVDSRIPSQSLSSSGRQDQCFMPGRSPKMSRTMDEPMIIHDLESMPSSRGIQQQQRPPSASQDTSSLSQSTKQSLLEQSSAASDSFDGEILDTKVLVGNVPVSKRSERFLESYLLNLMKVRCTVVQYGEQFLAAFHGVIDIRVLDQKHKASKEVPKLEFTFYEVQDSRKLIVDHISEGCTIGYLKLHLEAAAGHGTVENVEKLSSNRALVTFHSSSSMKRALGSTQSWELENSSLSMCEYYDFMPIDDEEEPDQQELSFTAESLDDIQLDLKPREVRWLQPTLDELNNKLSPLKAKCSVNNDIATGDSVVAISPQSDAASVVNWEVEVRKVMEEYLSCFVEVVFKFPSSLESDIIKRINQKSDVSFRWEDINGGVILYGHQNTVNKVRDDLHHFVEEVQVDEEEKSFRIRYVTLLSLRCRQKLNTVQVEDYKLNKEDGNIYVRGTKVGREKFWKVVEYETSNLIEKKIDLSPELYDLLQTPQGIQKIHELIGMSISSVVYCLEKDESHNCHLYLVCPSIVGEDRLKEIKRKFKVSLGWSAIAVEPSKHRFCRDVKWSKLVYVLEQQSFVSIVLDQRNNLINVCGEKIVVGNVVETLDGHLRDVSSVEEQLEIDYCKWKIMFSELKHKVDAIEKDYGKNIRIISPNKVDNLQCKMVPITIQGDPTVVDSVKVKLLAVEREVCHVEEKISNIPAAHRLLTGLEPRMDILQLQKKACIDVKVIDDDILSQSKLSSSKSFHSQKIGSATLQSEVKVSLYADNFTKHPSVHTIINFVREAPSDSDTNLKFLFDSAHGKTLQNEFHNTINRTVNLSKGTLLKMDTVDGLECNELYYAILPCWSDGSNNEEYYLEQCLHAVQDQISHSGTLLLTSACSKPLVYPAKVFAKQVVNCFSSHLYNTSDLIVAVYVSEASDAKEFQDIFENPKMRCRSTTTTAPPPQAKDGGKTISHSINSYITLVKGNLLEHQADAYVCSTNVNLELKNAAVSKALLDACGEDLQKECSQHAPLNMGEVAVTDAKNMKCKCEFIFHVVLPDHSDRSSERKFRQAMQTILRTAKEKKIASIAIPSLGIGNLHFPASVSARIIYEEIMSFRGQNPQSNLTCILVIFEKKHFNEFSKIHAQKMDNSGIVNKVSHQRGQTESTLLSVENLDISEESSNIIVNTTSEKMALSDSAVSKALLKKAGSSLQHACDQLVQDGFLLDHGQIVDTKSYGSLKCQKIIHAHVPPRADAIKASVDHFSLIHDIVFKCLEKAEQLKMASISFPAFGFGQGGYSLEEVARPMLTALQEFGRKPHKTVEVIRIVIFDPALHKEFYDYFVSFFNLSGSLPSRILQSITSMVTGNQGRVVNLQESNPSGASRPPMKSGSTQSRPNSTIVFNVYAATESTCKQVADQLAQMTRESYKSEPIVNRVIKCLIDTDLKKIKSIEKECQVSIKIDRQINQMVVQGEKSEVTEAKARISEMLFTMDKDVQLELSQYNWYSCNDGDDTEEVYSHEDSFMLERAHQSGVPAIELVIDDMEVVINLQSHPMEERSKSTGNIRTVKRIKRRQPFAPPDHWTQQETGVDGKPLFVCRVEVKEGTQEYTNALKRFHETVKYKVTVLKLERIQNPFQYSLHTTVREGIARKYNKSSVEERQLFHGLKEASIDPVMTTGFNRSFAATANAAYYGVGVYFALNASYSAQDKYAVPDKDKTQYMFICNVIIGKYAKGENGMRAPPPLQPGSNHLHDTLVENPANPTIFVAVKDGQAYPDYLVSFKKN